MIIVNIIINGNDDKICKILKIRLSQELTRSFSLECVIVSSDITIEFV